ncbi:MAG TPA: glycosyltransferase [Rhizomicrobium sp.]|nr:glycosyltransferase [Rhizomicrobium sp.]
MRVAVVHEWLETYAGSERTLEQILLAFPEAELFCLVDFLPDKDRHFLRGKTPRTSFIQKLPFARRRFRSYLPLFPMAVEQFDLSSFDIVISNSHAVAKGVTVGPRQFHVSHCCSPMRYAWDLRDEYLREANLTKGVKGAIARAILHYLRIWDAATTGSVDEFVAISHFVAARIRKFYGRSSVVVYPPVDVSSFTPREQKEDFYLAASRQVPYKRIDVIVEAFRRMPHRRLVVIGDGPQAAKIQKIAAGCPNIQLLGYQPFSVLKDHMQRARAFLFAAKEDFGIIVLEAQACGTPVIAYGEGGALETVVSAGPARTGLFFDEQTPEAIMETVERFESERASFRPQACRANAEQFAPEVFRSLVENFVREKYAIYRSTVDGERLYPVFQPEAAIAQDNIRHG